MNSTATIFSRLLDAPAIIDWLDEWNGSPAIFSNRAPDDFVFTENSCAIVIAAPSVDIDLSTFTETIRGVVQDVRIYARDNGSTAEIDELGRDIRDLFHLQPGALTVAGGACTLSTATGPVTAPTTDPSLIGRRVILDLNLKKDT